MSLLLSCLDDFLILRDFLVEVDLWAIISPSFSSHCPCWTSASVLGCVGTGWLWLSSVPWLLHVCHLVSFVVFWFALLYSCLACCWCTCLACCCLCSSACCWLGSSACCWLGSSACCWLFSSRFFSSSLQIFVFFSLASYPCCFSSCFLPLARWLWFCLGFSPLAPRLWFLLCFSLSFFFRVTLW